MRTAPHPAKPRTARKPHVGAGRRRSRGERAFVFTGRALVGHPASRGPLSTPPAGMTARQPTSPTDCLFDCSIVCLLRISLNFSAISRNFQRIAEFFQPEHEFFTSVFERLRAKYPLSFQFLRIFQISVFPHVRIHKSAKSLSVNFPISWTIIYRRSDSCYGISPPI